MNKIEKMLRLVLKNQKNIMIWIHGMETKRPFYDGYFKNNIENVDEMLEDEE